MPYRENILNVYSTRWATGIIMYFGIFILGLEKIMVKEKEKEDD
jgi:hypothetical protein